MTFKFKNVGLAVLFLAFLFLPFSVSNAGSGQIENFGSKYVFNAGDSTYIATAPLSSTKYIIVFRDVAHSNHGVAMVANVSGRTVTYGPQAIFDPDACLYMSVTAINSSRFSILYSDGGNANHGTIITGTVGGGDALSFTSTWVYSTGATDYNSISLLNYDVGADTGWLVVAYTEGGSGFIGRSLVVSVVGDGTTTDLGSRTTFNAAITAFLHVSALSSTSFIVVFTDDGDASQGTAMAATISGYIPTFGAEFKYNASSTSLNELATLTATKAVVAYRDIGDSDLGHSKILSVAGTVVTGGSEYAFEGVDRTAVDDIIALSSSTFMVAYADIDLGLVTLVREGSVSGTVITYDTEHYYHTSMAYPASLTYLTSGKFVVSFRDDSNSYYGTSMVADLPIFLHPIGTLVQVKSPYSPADNDVYIVTNTYEKAWIPNIVVYGSQFNWNKIVPIGFSELVDYDQYGGTYPYRDGELVKEEGSTPVYVFDSGQKRHITSASIFEQYKFSWSNIITAPAGSLTAYTNGTDLATYADNTYPDGSLLKPSNDTKVYYISAGNKRWVPDIYVYSTRFVNWSKIITVAPTVLSDVNYPVGSILPYRDGELVKEASTTPVYVFENELKRHIVDANTFITYDYSWSNIVTVPDGSLAGFGDGADLSISP